ncbi:MAG: hypothetical protein QGI09_04420, partial [Dehalococcoidia bacterium]|nr:hypothetical protein [Dehalococcoidia bacterium]
GEGRPCADGQMGDIVVTDLENYVFPLIRYVNGDRGHSVAGDAEDGIGFPLMGPVKGRVSEAVSLPDGSLLTGEYLTTIFDEFPDCVKGFQVHQQADGSIDVIYIPSGDSSALEENVRVVQSRLLEVMASQVPVRFTAVDSIPHDRGKLRFVISDLASR